MNERDAFIRRICEEPDDDTVRLVFADWIEEQSNSVACHICGGKGGWMSKYSYSSPAAWCQCATCDGTGFEPDDVGHRARGIRWMCTNPQNSWVCLCWNGEPTCNVCKWMGEEVACIPRLHNNSTHYVVHRGFVNEIRLPLAEFRTHAATIFRSHPVTRVVLTDILIIETNYGRPINRWTYADNTPVELFPDYKSGRMIWWHNSETECRDYVESQLVGYGRSLVNLPPLPASSSGTVARSH